MAWLTEALIDLNRISHNLRVIRQRVGQGVRICPAVKADAYGHGAVEVSKRLERDGADMLAVAAVEEGIELRQGAVKLPILVLGALLKEQAGDLKKYRLTPIITDMEFAKHLNGVAAGMEPMAVHVKIDTGMGRLGFPESEALGAVMKIRALKNIKVEGLMTHFPSSDERDKGFTRGQIQKFKKITENLKKEAMEIPIIHSANSAAVIDLGESYFNMVRPGIMIYGLMPSKEILGSIDIRPAMKIVSRIVHIRKVGAGEAISYGRTFVTKRESLIGVVAMGYADGYNRLLSNRASVKVRGRYAPVVGRVCMDQFMIDLTEIGHVEVGSEVVVYSDNRAEANSVENIAFMLNTIPNEVVCAVSKRVKRRYAEKAG